MLQRLREKAQGWFSWLILGAIAVTFVLFGTSSYFSSGGYGHSVAKVNGSSISERDLDMAYQRVLQSPGGENLRFADPKLVKVELLQNLIEEKILLQNAKKMGMTVGKERLAELLKSIPFLRDSEGNFSQENYVQFLERANYTDKTFRELLRENMLQQQFQESIAGTAFSLPVDLSDYVKFSHQKRNFRYTTLDKAQFEKKAVVTDEDIQAYFDHHQKDFVIPEEISLEYVQLSLPDIEKNVNYTDKDIQEFYHDNLSLFTIPATAKVAHILINAPKEADPKAQEAAKAKIAEIQKELKAGKSFGELAKQYSDDQASAQKEGELEWFTAGEMIPEFEKAAFALMPGQVSAPVQTDFGYHLIKLTDKTAEHVKPFFEVKEEAISKFKQHQAQEKLIQLTEDLSQLAFDTPNSLQPIAEKLGKKVEKTELFSQETGLSNPLLNRPEIISAAFSTNVKEDKNNSELIKLDDDNYAVIRLAEYVPAKQKSLESVKSEIKAILVEAKTTELLHAEAQRIASMLSNEKELSNDKALSDFSWKTNDDVLRTDRSVDANLLETAFSIPREVGDNRAIKTSLLSNGDYAVVWLTGVKDGNLNELSPTDKKNYQAALERQWGQLEFALYVTDLINKAKIKKNLPVAQILEGET